MKRVLIMKHFLFLVVATGIYTASAFAFPSVTVPPSTGPGGTIKKISTYATSVVLYLDVFHNQCGNTTSTEVVIDWATEPEKKGLYATALAAFLSGKKVWIGLNDCNVDMPWVYRVDVEE